MGLKGSMTLPDSGLPVADAYLCLTKGIINITTYDKTDNIYLIATGIRENKPPYNVPSNVAIGKYKADSYVSIFASQEAREANKDPIFRWIVQVAFNDMTEYVVKLYEQLKIDFPNMTDC